MLVLLLPWQKLFNGVIVGAMYTPSELIDACEKVKTGEIFGKMLFYCRFCAYWIVVVLLLILSQVRSARWAKATLRRLDVI
jgi:succinate-acetate transporter protein